VLLALAVWLVAVFATRIVSLGSILAALTVAAASFLLPHQGGAVLEGFTVALAAFVIWAHRANIGRLLRGEELAFRRAAADPAQEAPTAGGSGGAAPSEGSSA
jgi:glycerol-3-phosphate acyltransferase PlsY